MKSFESNSSVSARDYPKGLKPEVLIKNYELERIIPDPSFEGVYSDYQFDMRKVAELSERYYKSHSPDSQLGKVAEGLVYKLLTKHEISKHLNFKPTSEYDDFFHGADVVVSPKGRSLQSVAALDITIDQEDIKGAQRYNDQEVSATRPIGLEAKLARTRQYSDNLADLDPSEARDLSGWIESGGLHEKRDQANAVLFAKVEKLFLMKYYSDPDAATDSDRNKFVIGGPQTIISIDSLFITKALQGDTVMLDMVGDLSVLEFICCIQAEQAYLDSKIQGNKSRNYFFDQHYSKVRAWSHILEKKELNELIQRLMIRNQGNREFREQVSYYANTFEKVYN